MLHAFHYDQIIIGKVYSGVRSIFALVIKQCPESSSLINPAIRYILILGISLCGKRSAFRHFNRMSRKLINMTKEILCEHVSDIMQNSASYIFKMYSDIVVIFHRRSPGLYPSNMWYSWSKISVHG